MRTTIIDGALRRAAAAGSGIERRIRPQWPLRLAGCLAIMVIALVLSHVLWFRLQHTPFLLGFIAIILSGWLGGRWAVFVVTIVGAIGYGWFPLPVESARYGRLLDAFMIVSAVAGWLTSRRFEVEDQLRQSRQQLSALMVSLPVVLWTCDRRGIMTLIEGRPLESLGLTTADLVGRSVFDVFAAHEAITRNVRRTLDGEAFTAVLPIGTLTIETWYSPLRDSHGSIVGATGVSLDVSARAGLEHQYHQAQKMEAVGQLAAGIAHDFNNLLVAMGGYADLLIDTFDADDPRRDDVSEIANAAERAAVLTRQLLAFSRRQVLNPKVIDLNLLVGNIQRLLGRTIGADVEIIMDLAPAVAAFRADPAQVEHVLLNLALNARDAMPDGGRLRFTTALVDIDDRHPPSGLPMASGRYVRISVADTGVGMSPEVQARVFEPFFTTKAREKGTGLGLATAYGIVKQSGGFITVQSHHGIGTVFDIYFPAVDACVDAVPSLTADASRMVGGSETVLVAEDDAAVRRLVAGMLRRSGYSVLEARDGEEALSIAERCDDTIDLLMTDVAMPGMGGRTLASRLRGARKVNAVLYTSGYVDEARASASAPALDAPFLAKPFLPDQLLHQVRSALDAR